MLPPNVLIVSMVVVLTMTVTTAPVEEKETEEVEVEVTEEGELSEEDEDEDDSKSQDKIEGLAGGHQTTVAVSVLAAVAGSGVAAAGGSHDNQDLSGPGSTGPAGPIVLSGVSKPTGSDGVDFESNGNGQKLLNGGGGGGGYSQTGVLGPFGGGASSLDYTGTIDPSSHDFLLGLMGHVTLPTHLDSTDHPSDVSIDQSGVASPSSDQSLPSAGLSHSPADAASSQRETHRVQTDGAESPDTNGNGRQTILTVTNAGKLSVLSVVMSVVLSVV
ncbi:uncharacterized protein si:ch211-80h18.1 [Etheostoma spectabile]|uniref:uncharacterized protein si:ch211-80h18.1 n=1 Tax=Etheostoma spectabile TaxID=54343 RepID=UPI0013AF53BB|nr:uncharacterized protein LOC116679245 [Etheostoma spectabile]